MVPQICHASPGHHASQESPTEQHNFRSFTLADELLGHWRDSWAGGCPCAWCWLWGHPEQELTGAAPYVCCCSLRRGHCYFFHNFLARETARWLLARQLGKALWRNRFLSQSSWGCISKGIYKNRNCFHLQSRYRKLHSLPTSSHFLDPQLL